MTMKVRRSTMIILLAFVVIGLILFLFYALLWSEKF
ncbi:potassium-transporting ATPase subunit F [Staphylococcus caprae]